MPCNKLRIMKNTINSVPYPFQVRPLQQSQKQSRKQYYLVTTDHLEESIWFRDNEDFTVGMNFVAIQASLSDVVILAFILMSNHVHFVLYGTEQAVHDFIRDFKSRYSQYYGHKWGVKSFLKGNNADIQLIPAKEESLERSIAYTLMNCVAARICSHPSQYPWGSGGCIFSAKTEPPKMRVGQFSGRKLEKLLHSNCTRIPAHWEVSATGYILPEFYVDVDRVEHLMRSPIRYDYFLRNSSKARKRLEVKDDLPAFKDQTILAVIPDLCQSLFRKSRPQDLSAEEHTELMRQIRYRFCSNVNQIARICGLTYAEAAQRLDSY